MFRIASIAVVVALFAPTVASAQKAPLTRGQMREAQRVVEHDIDDDSWGEHYVGARRLSAVAHVCARTRR